MDDTGTGPIYIVRIMSMRPTMKIKKIKETCSLFLHSFHVMIIKTVKIESLWAATNDDKLQKAFAGEFLKHFKNDHRSPVRVLQEFQTFKIICVTYSFSKYL